MEVVALIFLGAMIFFPILYYTVRAAVEVGTLKALIEFDGLKNRRGNDEQLNK